MREKKLKEKRERKKKCVKFSEDTKTYDGLEPQNLVVNTLVWECFNMRLRCVGDVLKKIEPKHLHLLSGAYERLSELCRLSKQYPSQRFKILPRGGGKQLEIKFEHHYRHLRALREIVRKTHNRLHIAANAALQAKKKGNDATAAVLEPDQIEFGILILWYGMFGFFRMIGKVARDRGESTSLLSLFVLISSNVLWFRIAYDAMSPRSVSESLLVMFESALNMIDLIHVTLFILLHYKEMYLHGGHWEMRRSWNYHVNVFADFFWDSFNLLHCIHVWILKGFSFTLVDAILLLSMKGVCSDLWVQYQDFSRYRETMNGFHVVLRDVTKSDLEKLAKEPCSICLSKLTRTVKCLPCGHFFHRVCIRNWLESKNSNRKCPVCRKSVFEDDDDKHRTSVVTTFTNDDVNNNDEDTIDTSNVDNTRRVVPPSSPRPRRQRRLFDVNFMDFHLSLSQEENNDNNVE
eukprot:g5695.t1